jgi:hypothetical protein
LDEWSQIDYCVLLEFEWWIIVYAWTMDQIKAPILSRTKHLNYYFSFVISGIKKKTLELVEYLELL